MQLQTREGLSPRHDDYLRERPWVSGVGAVPLLLVYVLIHTKVLRQYLPASRELSVLVLIGLPLTWLFGIVRLHRWLGPIRHRLRCGECHRPLVDKVMQRTLATGRCGHCDAQVLADAGEDAEVREDPGVASAPR